MHVHGLGDVAQHHGDHRFFAVVEERGLTLHDAARHLQQGFVTNLQAAQQPARFLQLGAQGRMVGRAREVAGVLLVDPHFRQGAGVQIHLPAALRTVDINVWDDVLGVCGVNGIAGAGVAGANQRDGHFQFGVAGTGLPAQHGHLLSGDEGKMVQRDVPGQRQRWCGGVELCQLQRDAFAWGASGDPRGIECLHQHEYRFGLVRFRLGELGVNDRTNFRQRVAEVAVVIHGIDDGAPEGSLARIEARHLQLPEQVVPQGFAGRVRVILVAIVRAGPRCIAGGRRRALIPIAVFCHALGVGGIRDGAIPAVGQFRGVPIAVVAGGGTRLGQRDFEAVVGLFVCLEHDVRLERLANLLLQVECRQLQQPDGLLQLGSHRQLLAETELQGGLEHLPSVSRAGRVGHCARRHILKS